MTTKHIHIGVGWPYANGNLHLGHLAGALLPADIFARYQRLKGNKVLLVSGSDAHGTPITIAAARAHQSPRQTFTHYHQQFLHTLHNIGISFDLFTHTDTENHHRIAQDFFCRLYEQGYIYPETQQLLYSASEGRFLPDRYVEGTCPHCGNTRARGDQCEACNTLLNATDLINPRSTGDGSTPVLRESEHLFLNLPAFSERLLAHFDQHADHWRPNTYNFSRRFVADGLKGRPITRDLDWGIDVPLPGWAGKKLYIWFENIIGYYSAAVEWAQQNGPPEVWREWLQGEQAQSYYFIGKDNIPFHTIIWPSLLLGVSESEERPLNLPHDVPANENFTLNNAEFSKSRGHGIWLDDILSQYPPDSIRYAITAILPETRDSNFTWEIFAQRNDDELVATWGNLVHRVLSFTHKHWEGQIPVPGPERPLDRRTLDRQLFTHIEVGFTTIGDLIEAVKLRPALQECLRLARLVNSYLDEAPWFGVIKTDREAAATTVYTALQAINNLKILLAPFLPFTCEQLHTALGYERPLFGQTRITTHHEAKSRHEVLVYDGREASGRWQPSTLQPGQKLQKLEPLYRKVNDG